MLEHAKLLLNFDPSFVNYWGKVSSSISKQYHIRVIYSNPKLSSLATCIFSMSFILNYFCTRRKRELNSRSKDRRYADDDDYEDAKEYYRSG